MSFTIYADIESLIKKIDGYANNLENSSTKKIGKNISCGYPMSTIWAFDNIEKKYTIYRGEDFMIRFCTSLIEHTKT